MRHHDLSPEEIQVLRKLRERRHAMHWQHRWHRHRAQFNHSLTARMYAVLAALVLLSVAIVFGAVRPAYGAALMIFITGTAFGTIRRMLWPLRALARAAEAYGRGDFRHRVPIFRNDEIGELTHRFNQMAADIQAMLDGKRALLLAISHELRSPLTRARLHAELIEEGASKEALLSDLGEMRDLISALLESERLGAGHSALKLQDCDLAALLEGFRGEGIQIDIDSDLPILQLDPMRMQLLLRNLIENAKRHNEPANGPVLVSLRQGDGGWRLSVRDHGPGVPDAALAHLGEPFYRPDEARTRQDGGVGLGLNLCKMIAAAHGGRLEIRNATPGLEVALTLPVT